MSSFDQHGPGFTDIPHRKGVSADTLVRAGIRNITAAQAHQYGMRKPGFLIPYPRFDNRQQLVVEAKVFGSNSELVTITVPYVRIRLKDPDPKTGQKYDQALKSGVHAYFPPTYPTGKVKRIIVVEGEVKVLSLEENGISAVGMGGFWGWGYKEHKKAPMQLLPEVADAIRQGQPEEICLVGDNDTAINSGFHQSAVRFAHAVREITSAPVLIPRWAMSMPKGVDDVRDTMTAEQFQDWWQEVTALAIVVPATAAELTRIMVEPSQSYLTRLLPGEDRDKAFRHLAGCYQFSGYQMKSWLADFAQACGFDREALGRKADELREKTKTEIKARDEWEAGNSASVPPASQNPGAVPPQSAAAGAAEGQSRATGGGSTSPGSGAAVPPGTSAGGFVVRGLGDIAAMPIDPAQTLLGNRFLCREGTLMIVGPSGTGKSSCSVQQDILWGLGRSGFGIMPAKPLRILCVQAENDDGDMTLIARGVIAGLKLNPEEIAVVNDNVKYATIRTMSGAKFLVELQRLVGLHQPDLVRLDPLTAFIGADPKETEVIQDFLRTGITSIAVKYNCGMVIVHHTPKTNYRDTSTWKQSDWMYACAGAADITNWARAIIVIDPMDTPGLFRFIAAKRTKQIGWKDEFWQPVSQRYFAHAKGEDAIYWVDVDASALPKPAAKLVILPEDLLQFVPEDAQIHKALLVQEAQQKLGIGVHKADDFITILIEKALLVVVQVARKGSRAAIFLKRRKAATADIETITSAAINAVDDGCEQLSLTTVAS